MKIVMRTQKGVWETAVVDITLVTMLYKDGTLFIDYRSGRCAVSINERDAIRTLEIFHKNLTNKDNSYQVTLGGNYGD